MYVHMYVNYKDVKNSTVINSVSKSMVGKNTDLTYAHTYVVIQEF